MPPQSDLPPAFGQSKPPIEVPPTQRKWTFSDFYECGGGGVVFLITFIGSWVYCIVEYGYLLGVGLGWLPSLIVAVIAAFLWPLIALAIVVLAISYLAFVEGRR